MATEKAKQQQLEIGESQPTTDLPVKQEDKKPIKAESISDPAERFMAIMNTYELRVLPDLLKSFGIEPALFKQTVINEVKKNDKLMDAFIKNPSSMFASILAGAQIGLIPSEMLGLFYLIPRKLKQPNDQYLPTVTPLIGYKGMVNILMRNPEIARIHTEVVYSCDRFEVTYGLEPNIVHIPDFHGSRTAADITHVYAVAKMRGENNFAVMTRDQVIAVKNMSKYDNDLYFNDKQNPNRWMERKTVLTQLAKMLPKEYYLNLALEMDARLNGGATAVLDEEGKVKLIEGSVLKTNSRYRNFSSVFNNDNNSDNS